MEYSLIIALIALVAIAGMTVFGAGANSVYDRVRLTADAMIDAVN